MLNTDLRGFIDNCKTNSTLHLIVLIGVCICLYFLLSKYINQKSDFNNIVKLQGILKNMNNLNHSSCNKDIPRIDENIIKNTINLPNRNPALLTSSMVYPESPQTSDEEKKRTRMDILNMFYSSYDDDLISIKARPQNLYIIP